MICMHTFGLHGLRLIVDARHGIYAKVVGRVGHKGGRQGGDTSGSKEPSPKENLPAFAWGNNATVHHAHPEVYLVYGCAVPASTQQFNRQNSAMTYAHRSTGQQCGCCVDQAAVSWTHWRTLTGVGIHRRGSKCISIGLKRSSEPFHSMQRTVNDYTHNESCGQSHGKH